MKNVLRSEITLFVGISRRLFTLSAAPLLFVLLLLPLASLWVGLPTPSEAYAQCLWLTLAASVLLSMNLFPQEMEDGTLEVTFTLPSPRDRLVLRQASTVWIWLAVFLAVIDLLYFFLSGASPWRMALAVLPPALLFSSVTLWLSAVFRSGPLAGLVVGVAALLHYRYLPRIAFLALFVDPFAAVTDSAGRIIEESQAVGAWTPGYAAAFWSLVLFYVFVELLLRRMRRSELWLR